ncbi:MAG: DUF3383 domain-containing protein [Deltaproteobacteria bacterium]|nr:DUF3383 domain-containing protein [Deltaproteobacteria bacterium]
MVRATTPATNNDLAASMDTALDTAAAALGSLDGVVVPSSITSSTNTVTFEIADGLPSGTVTVSDPETPDGLEIERTDADVGSALLANSYNRTSLWYHPTDADLLAERVMSRCFGTNLDQQQLSWGYKQLVGVTGTTTLSSTTANALRNVNVNYFAPTVSSQGQISSAFTAPGWVSAGIAGQGTPIAAITSVDWMHARLEEGLLNMFLREPNAIFLDKDGIGRAESVVRDVFATGLAADHLSNTVVRPVKTMRAW